MRNTHLSWQIYQKIALIRFKVGLVSPYFGLFKFNKNPTASDRHKYFSQTCHSSATGKLENYCSLKAEILIFSWTVDILMVFFTHKVIEMMLIIFCTGFVIFLIINGPYCF